MPVLDADHTFRLFAGGIVDLSAIEETDSVVQDERMPRRLRRALARLSAHCLVDGVADRGVSVHDALAMAADPPSAWGVPSMAEPDFPWGDVALVDPDLGVPSRDCLEIAGGDETEIAQDLRHEQLRAQLARLPQRRRPELYSAVRTFVVRNPAVRLSDLKAFGANPGRVVVARTLESFYRQLPIGALWNDGRAYLCGECSSVLWPEGAHGRCRLRACPQHRGGSGAAVPIDDPENWLLADRAILAYWVGPGLSEIAVFDRLRAAGLAPEMYPGEDRADVGLGRRQVGIDVKDYASPVTLARALSRGDLGLAAFRERYLAVPDARVGANPDYLATLRDHYRGSDRELVMDSVSGVVERVVRDHGPRGGDA
jgi:hypothetical protein